MDSFKKAPNSSEKSFGIVFSILFLAIGLYPLLNNNPVSITLLVMSAMTLFLGLCYPSTLVLPNKIWMKFGVLLSHIMTPVIMAIMYFVIIVPLGIVMKLLFNCFKENSYDKSAKTYWKKREPNEEQSMKNQF